MRRYLPPVLLLISGVITSLILGTPNPENLGKVVSRGAAGAGVRGVAGSYQPASFVYGNPLDWIVLFLLVSFTALLILALLMGQRRPQGQLLRTWMTLVPTLIALDILSKAIIVSSLPPGRIYWSAVFSQPLEIVGVALCSLVLVGTALRHRSRANAVFCALILAGAASNIISGLTYHGYIPDFFVMHVPATALFNLADVLVFLGISGALINHLVRLLPTPRLLAKGSLRPS